MLAENRHFKKINKNKHYATKCKKAKCFICHSAKILKLPSNQLIKSNQKNKNYDKL